jgi:hypothetical protein
MGERQKDEVAFIFYGTTGAHCFDLESLPVEVAVCG